MGKFALYVSIVILVIILLSIGFRKILLPNNNSGAKHDVNFRFSRSDKTGYGGHTALHIAAINGDIHEIKRLLDLQADINAEDDGGLSPLHYAIMADSSNELIFCIEILLRSGSNINASNNKSKSTPLHLAARYGKIDKVKVLIKHGARVNSMNADGQTPLHYLCKNSRGRTGDSDLRVLRYLLEAGADPLIKDVNQQYPIDLAVKVNNMEFIVILKERMDEMIKVNNVLDANKADGSEEGKSDERPEK
jgi:ankyrin repeat protein